MKWNQTSPDLWQSICCICMRSMLGPGSCSSSLSRSQSRSRPPEQCRTSPTSGPPWASHTFLYAIILPETHMQIIKTGFILYNNKFQMNKKCFWCYKKNKIVSWRKHYNPRTTLGANVSMLFVIEITGLSFFCLFLYLIPLWMWAINHLLQLKQSIIDQPSLKASSPLVIWK